MITLPNNTITEAVTEYLEHVKNPEKCDTQAIAIDICDTIETAFDNGEAEANNWQVGYEIPARHTRTGNPRIIYIDVDEWAN